jgi:4-amino-4-deoxy-L-arabinose transferase-like glycosyltransferase
MSSPVMNDTSQDSTSPKNRKDLRQPLLWLMFLFFVLGFAFQGTRALWNTDEGRYTGNALQMVDSGDYLVPAYSPDRVNFTKPPMTYWAISASVKVFGRTTWAARIPNALAYLLTGLLVFAMGRVLVPEKPWLPALVYACALAPFMAANVVSTDTLLTLFEALAMYGFIAATFGTASSSPSRRASVNLMWLGFGLAFLTKGPPGLMPLLGVVPFMIRRDGWRGVRACLSWSGFALFLISGFLWYAVVMIRHPWLVHYYLHNEIYERIFTGVQNRNPQWYGWLRAYGPVFLVGTLPWWGSLLRGVRRVASVERLRSWWNHPSAPLFLLLWFSVPLVVFCVAKSRLPVYVLPLFLPLSLMLAIMLRTRINLASLGQRVALVAWIVVMLGIKGGISYFGHPLSDERAHSNALNSLVDSSSYHAIVFVQDTDYGVAIEEHTPWGMRLYTGKTIYGVAWRKTGAKAKVCRLLQDHEGVLFALDENIRMQTFDQALASCHGNRHMQSGHWWDRKLVLAHAIPVHSPDHAQ